MSTRDEIRAKWVDKEFPAIEHAEVLRIQAHFIFDKGYDAGQTSPEVLAMREFLKVFQYQNRTRGYPTGSEWMQLVKLAEEASGATSGERGE